MNSFFNQTGSKILLVLLVLTIIAAGYGGYEFYTLDKIHESTKTDLGNRISNLETQVSNLELEKTSLSDALFSEQGKNEEFERQIKKITGTIGTLEKLSQIDPELLKKYSKVFFLNEHYEPSKLVNINSKYLFDKENAQFIHSDIRPFLEDLIDDATRKNIDLKVVSGFRSFKNQSGLKNKYNVTYGAGTANQFSAEQGYSEHQLGTTVDFTVEEVGGGLDGFETSEAYEWLLNNAYKYGFVLSYPEGNTYYQFEPWHWRFVGIKLAKKLDRGNEFFYDLEQREIDTYLINFFDKS